MRKNATDVISSAGMCFKSIVVCGTNSALTAKQLSGPVAPMNTEQEFRNYNH